MRPETLEFWKVAGSRPLKISRVDPAADYPSFLRKPTTGFARKLTCPEHALPRDDRDLSVTEKYENMTYRNI